MKGAGSSAAPAETKVKVELALQQPEQLDYDSLQWTPGVRGAAPSALIPADRVEEFVDGEGLRCGTKFVTRKTRGKEASDKVLLTFLRFCASGAQRFTADP
jgi:hypothetical protein